MIKVAPSILAADYAALGEAVQKLEQAGADAVHIDVMDGHYVPPITIGAQMVMALHRYTSLPFDVHLMVDNPARHIPAFADAGVRSLSVHAEVCSSPHQVLRSIHDRGCEALLALQPEAPWEKILPYEELLDGILFMGVHAGYGGQRYIPEISFKISGCARYFRGKNRAIDLQVDGGVNADTAPAILASGATTLVAGSYVFNHPDMAAAIRRLRQGE